MIGHPNTPYQVRLIQGPRPGTQKCNAGDPGVASAVLNTDGNGVGTVTLHDALRSGATNAWVFVDGPPSPGQIRGDFYTSDILTSLSSPIHESGGTLGLHRIRCREYYLLSIVMRWASCALVGTGHPYGQHTGVVRRGDRVPVDVRRQPERPAERAVAHLCTA